MRAPPAGRAAAAGSQLISSAASLGGFGGRTRVGALLDLTGGYTGGLLALTVVLTAEALLVLRVRPTQHTAAADIRPSST